MKRKEKQENRSVSKRAGLFALSALALLTLLAIGGGRARGLTTPSALYPSNDQAVLQQIPKFIHPGAGEQYIQGNFTIATGAVAPSAGVPTFFNASNTTHRPAFFQPASGATATQPSFLASLYDFWVADGKVFIGVPFHVFKPTLSATDTEFQFRDPYDDQLTSAELPIVQLWKKLWGTSPNQFSASFQRVNVAGDGGVRSLALAHQFSDPQRVCVDANGVLTLSCPASANTNTYSCTGTQAMHTKLCPGATTGLSQDTPYTLVSACSGAKCELICSPGYQYYPGNSSNPEGSCQPLLACGSADGAYYSATPPSSDLCLLGSASAVSVNGSSYSWTCGSGSVSISCSAYKVPASAQCGSADGQISASAPSANLCASGTATLPGLHLNTTTGGGTGGNNSGTGNGNTSANNPGFVYENSGGSAGYASVLLASYIGNGGSSGGTYEWLWHCVADTCPAGTRCTQSTLQTSSVTCTAPYGGATSTVGQCDNTVVLGCSVGQPDDLAVDDTPTHWRWRCIGTNGNSPICEKAKTGNNIDCQAAGYTLQCNLNQYPSAGCQACVDSVGVFYKGAQCGCVDVNSGGN